MDAEPTSPSAPHALNHDSMVTVALSDKQSSFEHAQLDWRTLDAPPTPTEMTHLGQETKESFGPVPLQDAVRTPLSPDDETSTDEVNNESVDGDVFANEVDWENLDKTEEQESRGEGSDDVSGVCQGIWNENGTLTFLP